MNIKLIVAIAGPEKTDTLMDIARGAGATGATILTNARGEGMFHKKGVLGLDLIDQRDVLLFLVPERLAQQVLDSIVATGEFDESPRTGVACDPVGQSSDSINGSGSVRI